MLTPSPDSTATSARPQRDQHHKAPQHRGKDRKDSMKPSCPECLTIHPSNDGRAIGRFSGNIRYAANFDGAPIRPTRALAEQDACDRRKAAL